VFLSPPWGGPKYSSADSHFDIKCMRGLDGFEIYRKASLISPNVAYYLPKNTDCAQLKLLDPGQPIEVEKNIVNDWLKTVTVYFGDLIDFTVHRKLDVDSIHIECSSQD
jgi:trimethylguanosine synthase